VVCQMMDDCDGTCQGIIRCDKYIKLGFRQICIV
jgi:hypothetical protein